MRQYTSCYIPDELKNLRSIYPVVEAQTAVKEGRIMFKEIYGYSLQVPGNPYCCSKVDLVEIIPGTTDAVCSNEYADLQSFAYEFAELFNRALFKSIDRF